MAIEQPSRRQFDPEEFRALRAQDSGDFNTDTGAVYDQTQTDFDKGLKFQELIRRQREIGSKDEAVNQIKKTITELDNAQLLPEAQNNQEQQQLLQERRAYAKYLIINTLTQADEYIKTVRRVGQTTFAREGNELEGQAYREELVRADHERRLKHNALISDLNIVNRFIKQNFGQTATADRQKSGQILKIKPLSLSKNIICPDKLDTTNRHQVADWAVQVSQALAELKNCLEQEKNLAE